MVKILLKRGRENAKGREHIILQKKLAEAMPLSTLSGRPVHIIYGTAWKKERTAELVRSAVKAGFRAIDTACQPKHYDEAQVGVALEQLLQEPQNGGAIRREDIFVQTKFTSVDGQDPARVPYDRKASLPDQVRQSMARSLANLRVDFVDSLVLHGPMRTLDENRLVWRTFEELHAAGKTKRIGLSNCYDLRLLRTLYDEAHIRPAVLQNRFHAETGHDRDIRAFCTQNGIVYQSFWTLNFQFYAKFVWVFLAKLNYVWKFWTANPHALHSTVIRDIAKKRGITPEQLFYRFTIDIGITPLSGTTNTAHMAHDVLVPDMPPLSAEEIGQIESILYYGQGKKS
uniref:NADP-dependent oxidoreductase domain-containing protein n=1 Tax=Globodera rostochiensis TaxID=31243 RepID=A0A914ICD0_GLORO